MLEGGIDLAIVQPLAAQVETDLERAMSLGGTGPHRHGTIAFVIDPVVTAAVVDHRLDHLFLIALLAQASGQLRLGTLAAGQTAHGIAAGSGQLFGKGRLGGLDRFGHGFINHHK